MEITLSSYFEFNPFDNKVSSDFLKFMPEAEKLRNSKNFKIDAFWSWFYYDNTNSFQSTTDELIKAIREPNCDFIVFKGPSGSGKTTYLRNIIRESDKFFSGFAVPPSFDVVNLIEDPYLSNTDKSLFIHCLNLKIIRLTSLRIIKELYTTIAKSKYKKPIERCGVQLMMNSFTDFVNLLGECEDLSSDDEIRIKISLFVKKMSDVSDVIALYFIFYIFKNCLVKKNRVHYKPAVFIFDNLDELEFRYLARELTIDFSNAFSKTQGFFDMLKGTKSRAGGYEFVSHCTIIESVREGFVADINNCKFANQHGEREALRTCKFDFECNYQNASYLIAKKRYNLFKRQTESIGRTVSKEWFYDGRVLEDEKGHIQDISKLFNYDYRMTLSCLASALTQESKSWEKIAQKDNDCILGIRCYMLFHILKSLYRRDTAFSKYVSAELYGDSCNKNRMFMSLLTNMDKLKNTSNSDLEEGIRLADYTKKVKKWYNSIPVENIYETIFVSNNNNYSMPAGLEGLEIDSFFMKEKNALSLDDLCKHLAKLYNEDSDDFYSIKIIVNPVCSAYTEQVFINYEYFNLISIAQKNNSETILGAKSLFEYETFEDIQSCLDRVFKVTSKIIRRADNHVCNKCGNCKHSPSNKEIMCEKQVIELDEDGFLIRKNTLYKIRVITSHINYLDSFRKLQYNRYHEQNQELNEKIHNLILSYIGKYIVLYQDTKVLNKSAEEKILNLRTNFEKAKNDCNIWTPIKIGL